MIERLDRTSIFKLNKTFAAFILEEQDAIYNPSHDYNKYEPEEMIVHGAEAPTLITQAMCDQWNKDRYEDFLQKKDHFETAPINDKNTGSAVYHLPRAATATSYFDNLANTVSELADRLQWKSVLFLLNYSIPWLHQDSDYEPVKKALDHLKRLGVDENFTGGFKASGPELKEFVKNLSWIIRCNASLPTCYFSGIDTDFSASICQYGNLHFYFYSESCQLQLNEAAKDLGMVEVEDGNCTPYFSED